MNKKNKNIFTITNKLLLLISTLSFFIICSHCVFAADSTNVDLNADDEGLKRLEQLAEMQKNAPTSGANVEAVTQNVASPDLALQVQPAAPSEDALQKLRATPMGHEEAFTDVLQNNYPLSPEQIVELKKQQNNTEAALIASPEPPPRPSESSQYVKLAPGSTPPVVRLGEGFVTAVVFLDVTGAAWPIESYNIGDPKSFNVQWDRKGNIIMIQAMKGASYGNMAVRLKGLATPVMVTFISGGQQAVDYRADLLVEARGPNAKAASVKGEVAKEDPGLLEILAGIAPPGSQALQVSESGIQAWSIGGSMYVRTKYKILSPAWRSSITSADGSMIAYDFGILTPSILVNKEGTPINVSLKG